MGTEDIRHKIAPQNIPLTLQEHCPRRKCHPKNILHQKVHIYHRHMLLGYPKIKRLPLKRVYVEVSMWFTIEDNIWWEDLRLKRANDA